MPRLTRLLLSLHKIWFKPNTNETEKEAQRDWHDKQQIHSHTCILQSGLDSLIFPS